MARRTVVVDDLDGSEEAREVTFSLDGDTWRIDLAEHNRQRLRAALGEFIEAGVKIDGGRGRKPGGSSAGGAGPSGTDTTEIREWARANGYQISDRGRIPAAVLEAFESAS